MNYSVVEIFDSIEGEGKRTGQPATFVRLAHCNLKCVYCDTKRAWDNSIPYSTMSLDDIIARLNINYKRVTLTGGEPLLNNSVNELIITMCNKGYSVNIETNGAIDIGKLVALRNAQSLDLFFSIDYKLPYSGESSAMIEHNFDRVDTRDIVKFVIGDDLDIQCMLQVIDTHKLNTITNIFIGAVDGVMSNNKLATIILEERLLADARIQVQLHKIIGVE